MGCLTDDDGVYWFTSAGSAFLFLAQLEGSGEFGTHVLLGPGTLHHFRESLEWWDAAGRFAGLRDT